MVRPGAWLLLVLVLVTTSLSEGQEEAPRERRAPPSGFLGMRGKKDSGMMPEDNNNDIDYPAHVPLPADLAETLYRNPSPLTGVLVPLRGKKAPSGFLGMRGKKNDEEQLYASEGGADAELEALMKRAPSGFLGMRGKKAPSGFLGMRGKKAPSGFLGMRGKKMYADDEEMTAIVQALAELQEGQDKRAPSGFLGMRGKRYYDDSEEANLANLHKRAPSGFLGMRG